MITAYGKTAYEKHIKEAATRWKHALPMLRAKYLGRGDWEGLVEKLKPFMKSESDYVSGIDKGTKAILESNGFQLIPAKTRKLQDEFLNNDYRLKIVHKDSRKGTVHGYVLDPTMEQHSMLMKRLNPDDRLDDTPLGRSLGLRHEAYESTAVRKGFKRTGVVPKEKYIHNGDDVGTHASPYVLAQELRTINLTPFAATQNIELLRHRFKNRELHLLGERIGISGKDTLEQTLTNEKYRKMGKVKAQPADMFKDKPGFGGVTGVHIYND